MIPMVFTISSCSSNGKSDQFEEIDTEDFGTNQKVKEDENEDKDENVLGNDAEDEKTSVISFLESSDGNSQQINTGAPSAIGDIAGFRDLQLGTKLDTLHFSNSNWYDEHERYTNLEYSYYAIGAESLENNRIGNSRFNTLALEFYNGILHEIKIQLDYSEDLYDDLIHIFGEPNIHDEIKDKELPEGTGLSANLGAVITRHNDRKAYEETRRQYPTDKELYESTSPFLGDGPIVSEAKWQYNGIEYIYEYEFYFDISHSFYDDKMGESFSNSGHKYRGGESLDEIHNGRIYIKSRDASNLKDHLTSLREKESEEEKKREEEESAIETLENL